MRKSPQSRSQPLRSIIGRQEKQDAPPQEGLPHLSSQESEYGGAEAHGSAHTPGWVGAG